MLQSSSQVGLEMGKTSVGWCGERIALYLHGVDSRAPGEA